MAHKPSEGGVINSGLTATPLVNNTILSGGKLTLAGNTPLVNILADPLILSDATAYRKIAYAAGTAQISTIDLSAVALLADSQYSISVEFPKLIGFNNVQVNGDGGRAEANELTPIREYVVSTGASAPTANELRDLFIARINADAGKRVTAASGGAGTVQLTQDVLSDGAFTMTAPSGAVIATGTPHVAPAGTPAVVNADFPNQADPAGTYTTYEIDFVNFKRSNVVSGALVGYPEFIRLYVEVGQANRAAFETALDAQLDGTHTPVSDYLGI